MSRKLLTFLLSELQIVRVICQRDHCKGVIEVPVDRLAGRFVGGKCPLCGNEITFHSGKNGKENAFVKLGQAIEECQAISDASQIEFVVPDPS